MRNQFRSGAVAALLALPLAAAPALAAGSTTAAEKPLWKQSQDYWSTLAAPRVERPGGSEQVGKAPADDNVVAHDTTGFPPAARELAEREAVSEETGATPQTLLRKAGADPQRQRARLLTLLVEFNPDANDDFSGWERPDPATGECVTEPAGTRLSGPLHNELPDPATRGSGRDNNTFWVPDFSPSHYDKLIYSERGITKKVRKDLRGGVDIRGRTVRNFYLEMSKGAYELTGEVTPWLEVPHSEAWYSADSCDAGEASDVGHPDNPRGTAQMAIDAVERLAEVDPDFPWEEFDVEDQGDADGDGDLYEPDGVLDHVIVVHAGADQADDGGEQGTYAEWSSAQAVDPAAGGHEIADTGMRLFNFTTQAEDAGVGVIAHEYGHDLGLPDLYDVIGPGDTDVAFWDLMSTGSHSGPLFQTIPAHMGAWSKYVLGWVDPVELEYGSREKTLTLGQASRPPRGTADSVKINLPDEHVVVGEPHGGENAWWSNQDQDSADVRLSRELAVPAGSDVRFWAWNDYDIEELWDYGFIEVSTDGGSTWEQLEVHAEDGTVVSTDADPNGNLANYFGGLENGLTGDSGGYQHQFVDLTPYAGTTIQLRLRYATDAAFQERGWFADDFSLTNGGETVWSDDVEGGPDGWTAEVDTFTNSTGAGWVITTGEFDFPQYYLAEWRNFDGFDEGLKTPYDTNFFVDGEWNVNRTPYNAPGLLLWYRDGQYTFNALSLHDFDPPSLGAKGQTLLVDAHYEPERRRGEAAAVDPSPLDNLSNRVQAMDAAFGWVGRYPFRACVAPGDAPYELACNSFGLRWPQASFTDAKTWYPGLEYRPDIDPEGLFWRDQDASVVVPSRGGQIYSTRIVDEDGRLVRDLFGTPLGGGHVLGTGNPADGRPAAADGSDPGTTEDLSLGVRVGVLWPQDRNRRAVVRIRPGR
jgi:immune inhibitor A